MVNLRQDQENPSLTHSFENHWPNIQPLVRRLIYNQAINISEWQNLFCDVHMVCSWDERGCHKLIKALKTEFVETFIKETRTRLECSILEGGQQKLKEYMNCWRSFNSHCESFPAAFQQLDLATRKRKPHYLVNSEKKPLHDESTVRSLLLKLWNDNILALFNETLQKSAMELLSIERSGQIIDPQLVVGLRESLTCLDEYNGNLKKTRSPYHNQNSLLNHEQGTTYMQSFGSKYVQEIEIFYISRAEDVYCQHEILDYSEWALQYHEEELRKAKLYLGSKSILLDTVKQTCSQILMVNIADESEILEECKKYIRCNDGPRMKILYNFIGHVDSSFRRGFFSLWLEHIVRSSLENLMALAVVANGDCEKFVEKMIESYNQYDDMVKSYFSDEPNGKSVLDRAFELIVNDPKIFQSPSPTNAALSVTQQAGNNNALPEARCAELLTSYCDLLLRRTTLSRKLTPDDITERLKEVLFVMRFIKDKEALIKYHKMHLTRRLILGSSTSFEREEKFVANLRELPLVPIESLFKFGRMFSDIRQSEEILTECRKALSKPECNEEISNNNNSNNNNNNVIQTLVTRIDDSLTLQNNNNKSAKQKDCDFINIKVLNSCAWNQTAESCIVDLSGEIMSIVPSFETCYSDQYTGRKLDWCHQLSNATITFSTEKGKFDLDVTATQLSVLSAFNDYPKVSRTLKELESITNLNFVELRRALWVS